MEQTLARYALGAGPLRGEKDKLSYRFSTSDWEQIIRPLLDSNSIAFENVKNCETDRDILQVKKKVYLVENDLETLFALNVMLEDAGYDVLLSHCAGPLMEDILPPTDLFILDNCMPDGEGLEIYSKLMSHAETKDTPVIMISGDHDIQSKAMAAGVDDFLEKPFEMKELLRMVARHTNAAAC
ncbi:MAG TPA: response regulator [Chryseosolibacter sp.]|nr:response regulator [Chryseosolibacter sp.]